MKASIISPANPAWKAALASVHHDVYHRPEYVSLCAGYEAGEPLAVLVEDGSSFFLQPLLRRSLADRSGSVETWDASSPYGYPGPLISGSVAFLQQAVPECVALLHAKGCVSLFVRMHPYLDGSFVGHFPLGAMVRHGSTVMQDLTLSPEEMWTQTRSGHRYEINRARREGFEFEFDSDWAELGGFVRLYHATMERREASAFYFFPTEYFEQLRDSLGSAVRLATVRRAGALAAAAIFAEVDGIVQYHLSASAPEFSRFQPTKLLLHEARTWAAQRGNAVFHFGGGLGGAEDSLFQFKAGFSPVRLPFYTWRCVVDQEMYLKLCLACGRADENVTDLEGFFPAYRAS